MSSHQRSFNRQNQKPQQPQQAQVRVDLSQAENVACASCGNHTFVPVVLMKRLSPILSPTGQEAIVPIQTFACNACGFINKEFLPTTQRDESESRNTTPEKASSGIITTDLNV